MSQAEKLLIFRIEETLMAIELSSIVEVVEFPSTWPIPFAPACFRGAMNFHGRIVPIIDLASYLNSSPKLATGKTLVFDRKIADLAIWVHEVEKIISCSEARMIREGANPIMQGVLQLNGDEVIQLNLKGLVEQVESEILSSERPVPLNGKGFQ